MVLAPHPDDEAIGCGGMLCLHADRGDRISVVYLTSGEKGLQRVPRQEAWTIREAEAERGCAILGVASLAFLRLPDWQLGDHADAAAAALVPLLADQDPDLLYLPHPNEDHPDHRAALPIARAALSQNGMAAAALRGFEVWTPLARFDIKCDITAVMPRKLRAVRAHASQLNDRRYDRAIRGLNRYRGEIAATGGYAEVFRDLTASA